MKRAGIIGLGAGLALAAAASLGAGALPEPRIVPPQVRVRDPSDDGLSRRSRKRKQTAANITAERHRKRGPHGLSRKLDRAQAGIGGYRPHAWRP